MSILASILLLLSVLPVKGALFDTSPYLAALRLSSYSNLAIETYLLPNTLMKNFTSVALVMSGYDFPSIRTMQFRAQISYDDVGNVFEILVTTFSGSTYNFINYFIITVSQNGNNYFAVTSACLGPFLTPYAANRNFSAQTVGQFLKTGSNSIIAVPFIRSIQSQSPLQISTLNVNPVAFISNSFTITISIFNDNITNLAEVCLTIVLYHQSQALNDQFLSVSYSSFQTITASTTNNLNSVAGKNFKIGYQYGPILEPKCFIGLQSFQLDASIRQSLSFNISSGGVSRIFASNTYSINYGHFCVAAIYCDGQNKQYYPILNDCDEVCNISMCQLCQSSTACTTCSPGNFINPLQRCSPCSANCNNCSSASNCTTCSPGFFLNASSCKVCPFFCTACTGLLCTACQSGFLATGNECMGCSQIMLNCITCTAPTVCSLCLTTYYFNSNTKVCTLCNTTMPNCYVCNLPNNCLTCYPNFYLATFNKCSACTPKIATCCSAYITNCSLCSSNTVCLICEPAFFLTSTSNTSCSSCLKYDDKCNGCNSISCFNCLDGFYLKGSKCLSCENVIPSCTLCSNETTCLKCNGSLLIVQNQCINCPFWPISELYFLNKQKQCILCSNIIDNCKYCNSNPACTACLSLYYLTEGRCIKCQSSIAHCLTCSSASSCFICQSGYHLSANSEECLSCGTQIPNCGQCYTSNSKLACLTCLPEYFNNNSACSPCIDAIPFCLQCNGQSTCTLCMQSYYVGLKQQCLNCSTILTGCSVCLSKDLCSTCLDNYYNQGGFCTLCSSVANNCQKCSKNNNNTILCSQCSDSFYLDPFRTCQSCIKLFQNCASCTLKNCIRCISGFYIATDRNCTPCSNAVPYCLHCSTEIQCLICMEKYWLNTAKNICDSCFDLSKGCSTCQRLSISQTVNCSQCAQGYALYPSSNLIFTCLQCNITMKYCQICQNVSACSSCSIKSFLNQYSTCSLCSLYISNCQICSNSTQCEQCQQSYQLLPNGTCLLCNLSQFGVESTLPLCTQCGFLNNIICNSCIKGYYLNSQQSQCFSCKSVLTNCASCLNEVTCLSCLPGFQLSTINSQCESCLIPKCQTCFKGTCQKCFPGSYLVKQEGKCSNCKYLFSGCNSCTASSCLVCSDGYYLQAKTCISCSSTIADCVLCIDKQNCLLKLAPTPDPPSQNPLYKPFAIVTFILTAILIIVLILWQRYTGLPRTSVLQQQMPKFQTDRRIVSDEVYSNEVALQKGKICQNCMTNSSQVMRLELLCTECELVLKRGHKHKIRKEIKEKKKIKEALPPIQEEKQIDLQLQSKMDQRRKSTTKRPQTSQRQSSPSKRAHTNTTQDPNSVAMRNMF